MNESKSVFFIKHGLVAISTELEPVCPRWGPAHLFTEDLQVDAGAGFDDQLVVNVHGNEAVRQGPHGVAENITGGGLDDVLHELRPVGLQPLPFLCAADALVSDALAAELICTELGLHIREASAGRERDEEHPALVLCLELLKVFLVRIRV